MDFINVLWQWIIYEYTRETLALFSIMKPKRDDKVQMEVLVRNVYVLRIKISL